MSGVLIGDVQWERTTCCGGWVPIDELADGDTCPDGQGCRVRPEPDRYAQKVAFAAHWERVEVGRGRNRDGVVRITQPDRKRTEPARTGTKDPKRPSRPKVTVRVIRAY